MLWLGSEHDLEGVLVHFVQANIVVCHVRLQHCPLVYLFPPESEDRNAIPQATVDIYQIESPNLLASLLLLCSAGEVLEVLVTEAAELKGAAATRMIGVACLVLLRSRSCCNFIFLIATFLFATRSSRRVHKNAVIINVSCGSGWEGLIGVKRSVSSISHEGCSFLGAL